MPGAPEMMTLRHGESVVQVPIDKADAFIYQGYRPETKGEAQEREAQGRYSQEALPAFATGALSALSTASFGATDWALGKNPIMRRQIAAGRQEHGLASGIGTAIGIIGTEGAGGAGGLAARVVGAGGGLGRTIAREALVGAAYNTGGYVADQALGDRELTAQGFFGAMGEGGLFGGATAGVLGATERGLVRARSMFAGADVTKDAVMSAERDAVAGVGDLRRDADVVGDAARERMRGIRRELQIDPLVSAEHNAVAEQAAHARAAEAAPLSPEPGGADDLLAQLQGTKARLDAGESIGSMRSIEDSVNHHVGQTHGEMARLVVAERELAGARRDVDALMNEWRAKYPGGMVELTDMPAAERRQAMRDWAEGYQPKTPTEEAVREYMLAPKTAEPVVRLGGGEFPQEVHAAARGASASAARSGFLEGLPQALTGSESAPEVLAKATYEGRRSAAKAADDVYTAFRGGPTLDQQLAASLKAAEPAEAAPHEIEQAISAIGRLERAHADAVDALGSHAPPASIPKAQAQRAAEVAHAAKTTETVAAGAQVADRQPGILAKAAKLAGKVGEISEVMHMLGLAVPDVRDIPVIGPVLSMYLKAKVGRRLLKGGMMTGKTVEGVIASKSAALRNAIQGHVTKGLELAAQGMSKAHPLATPTATLIGRKLLHTQDAMPERTEREAFVARRAELEQALHPGTVENAIRGHVHTADSELIKQLVDTKTRQLDFLRYKLPKPSWPETDPRNPWHCDPIRLASFARYVETVDDPLVPFRTFAAGGMPSSEAIETLRACYPRLLLEGQQHAINQMASRGHEFSASTRVRLGVQLGLPLDRALAPGYGLWSQQGQASRPPAPPPVTTGSTRGGTVELGKMSTLRVDRERTPGA